MAAQAQPTPPSGGPPHGPTLVELTAKAAEAEKLTVNPAHVESAESAARHRVNSQPTADQAGEMLKGLAQLEKEIRDEYDPLAKAAHDAHKFITGRRAARLKPIQEAVQTLKRKLSTWLTEEEKRRAEKAREEAERLEAERVAEAAKMAEELEEEGYAPEEATALASQSISVAPAAPAKAQPVKPKVSGVSGRKVLEVEVVDLKALCGAIAEGKASPEFVKPVESTLKAYAKAFAGHVDIPGVRITKTTAVSRR